MNILFYGTDATTPNAGGIARITSNLLGYFNRKGFKAFAIARRNDSNKTSEKYQYYFPDISAYSDDNKRFLEKIIEINSINIIINQCGMSMSEVDFLYEQKAKFPTIKIISCIHNPILNQIVNYPYLKENCLRKHSLNWFFKMISFSIFETVYKQCGIFIRKKQYAGKLMLKSDKVVMLSPGHLKELTNVIGDKYIDKISYIPNCIVLNNVTVSSKENVILWIGAVDTSVKRIDFMLEVWQHFSVINSDWKLMILGDGPDLKWAKDFVVKHNINNIFFVGRVDPTEYYKKAKLSCVTSSYESFSMVIVESFKYGVVPIVNNSFPSASYLIYNEYNGLLTKKFNREDFLSALIRLTSSPELLNAMSRNSFQSSERFSIDAIGEKWLDLFATLIKS